MSPRHNGIRQCDRAALKAESNFVAGGTVLKLEVQILRRLAGRPHVPQLIHSGKKELYCYMVMTLLGDSLGSLQKKIGKVASVSTQTRVGINILFGVKQLHDIGFVHRDLKPANVAIGRPNTPDYRFLHILDFGLAREFVVIGENRKLQMRRPRPRALFREKKDISEMKKRTQHDILLKNSPIQLQILFEIINGPLHLQERPHSTKLQHERPIASYREG
ncbi:hypothetical protein ANCCEY_00636 [Ancylostoma ceylanicum]|uniref:Protein kinase domain-containing protein n=1 Tax=Ancylostoma ceylanicum TaxID=53326 RepID=A0A0D6M7U5_9BILA|nr:hypothetical protein ANCCEY_00636 [Ancylostoma ceylanicum]